MRSSVSFKYTEVVSSVPVGYVENMYPCALISFKSKVRTWENSLAAGKLTTGLGGVVVNILHVLHFS